LDFDIVRVRDQTGDLFQGLGIKVGLYRPSSLVGRGKVTFLRARVVITRREAAWLERGGILEGGNSVGKRHGEY